MSQDSITDSLQPFLLDLFQQMRLAGMLLTLDQFDLLTKATLLGYGLDGWDDLYQTCQLLWVKPSHNYDQQQFDQAFQRFRQTHQRPEPQIELDTTPAVKPKLGVLPKIPPRKRPTPEPADEIKMPTAVQVDTAKPSTSAGGKSQRAFVPTRLPVQMQDARRFWKMLRQWVNLGYEVELDFEATLNKIQQDGIFSDIVLSPARVRRAELLLLIDDSNVMIPFLPAVQPFIQAITNRQITPAHIYRFTTYPGEYLYPWHRPTRGEPLSLLLPRLHRNRTIVLIWSDAGAAMGNTNPEYIEGMTRFLQRLAPCVRQVLWANPLPEERWAYASAEAIAEMLHGQMFPLSLAQLQKQSRQPAQELLLFR